MAPGRTSGDSVVAPNIIFMMADDMGMGDTSAYQDVTGNADADQLHTPQMERLARMGMRFTDAHTPSSRCTTTRYALLTGRYVWRSRLKYWVLFGAQGDPLIERDRPTIASMLRDNGYGTYMVGKWHVGLRYRQADGRPAAGWADADLTKPLYDTPLDHGFDECRFTSRSHGTSGPGGRRRKNGPNQKVGPGHIHGRVAIGATGNGKALVASGPKAYVLSKLGGRHSDHAMEFLRDHAAGGARSNRPFFLYYPSNSNHGPYTPDDEIAGVKVAKAARSKAGEPMSVRFDYIHENDVALGRLLDWLEKTDDPRRPGAKLVENTIVIFTSDNGAENAKKTATGPFRSNKGSCYEGGHRVPFIVSWPAGGVPAGKSSDALVGLQDTYATFSEILGRPLPDLRAGEKGAEDSVSMLGAWRTGSQAPRTMFFNDHKEAEDAAVVAFRADDPVVEGKTVPGKWKIFFDASLLREAAANPVELYDLATDPREERNRVAENGLEKLRDHVVRVALELRRVGGHRLSGIKGERREIRPGDGLPGGVTVKGMPGQRVQDGQVLEFRFDRDVLVESATLEAGEDGSVGGFYRVGEMAPLAIYCVDGDNDSNDQHGILSDIGVVRRGEVLRFDSAPHLGVEPPGIWHLRALAYRVLE